MIPQVFGQPQLFGLVAGVDHGTAFLLDNPEAPTAEGSISLSSTAEALRIARRGLFALIPVTSNSVFGTVVPVDLSNPLAPVAQTPVSLAAYQPFDLAIGPNDDFALVPSFGSNVLVPFTLKSPGSPLAPIAGTPVAMSRPWGIAIDPKGQFALVVSWAMSGDYNVVYPVDLTTPLSPIVHSPVAITGLDSGGGPTLIVISPDSKSALVSWGQDGSGVTALDLTNPYVPVTAAHTATGSNPYGVAISPDGKSGLVANTSSGTVSALDLTNPLAPVAQTPVTVGTSPKGATISPDGKVGAVANLGSDSVTFLDLSNPLAPTVIDTVSLGYVPWAAMLFWR